MSLAPTSCGTVDQKQLQHHLGRHRPREDAVNGASSRGDRSSRTDTPSSYGKQLRIAAGLEDPGAAEALR
jgi:hypothetical protein